MSETAHQIVRFDSSAVKQIQRSKTVAADAQLTVMNDLAATVVDNGGFCDNLTFSTIFYGGIDPTMNWSDSFTNEQLSAQEIPGEFKTAQQIGRVVGYSYFEPFVARSTTSSKYDIGIVMPGSAEFEGGIGYKISIPKKGPERNIISGNMVFMGLSKVRDYRPYDEHDLFSVTRYMGRLETENYPSSITKFGVAAVREHLDPNGYFDSKQMSSIDAFIFELRLDAKQHANLARLK